MAAFHRLFRASIAPSVALGGAVVTAASTVALADEGASSVYPGRTANGNKLPIYSSPTDEPPVTLVVSPNPLTEYITTAREATCSAAGSAREVVEQGVSNWIGFERRVEREVKQIVAPDEPLVPGLIYVLVAGLTGSVLSRTRSFPVRFLAPPTFAAVALPYFLPRTAHNLRRYISDVEDKYIPEFAEKHDRFNSQLELHWHLAADKLSGAGDDARAWSAKAVEGVESATGLSVAQAVRQGQAKVETQVEKARREVAGKVAEVRSKVETVKDEAEAKLKADAEAIAPKYETIAVVVEQKPIAEIVAPVVEPAAAPIVVEETKVEVVTPADSGKRLV